MSVEAAGHEIPLELGRGLGRGLAFRSVLFGFVGVDHDAGRSLLQK